MSAHLLAKLTPHGVVITGAGFGGQVEISGLDVAGALGMGNLSRGAYLWGLLKYAGDHQALPSLTRIVRGHVFQLGKSEGWGLTDAQIVGLAQLAILENLHAKVCPVCNGCGTVAAKTCERCAGVGRVSLSKRKRAEIAGFQKDTWNRVWDRRSRETWAVVNNLEAELLAHLWRYLGGR